MIKIIKPGKKKIYHATCEYCGCEFTYEGEDRHSSALSLCPFYAICPCCGERVYEPFITINPCTIPNTASSPNCENCPYKDGLKDAFGNPVVGDSPCDFCAHNPMKVYCNSNKVED